MTASQLPEVDLISAFWALKEDWISLGSKESKDDLSPLFEAALTEVVLRLRFQWLAGCARSWHLVCAIDERSRSDLEKRVTTLLRHGFGEFSNLLSGLELFALELKETGTVREQTLLGLEQKFVHLEKFRSLRESISRADGALDEFLGPSDCIDGSADQADVDGHARTSFMNGSSDDA